MEGMYDEDIKIRSNNKQWRKLVDYYNQMREEKFGEKGYFKYTMRFDEVHLISKKMGFVEWLVKNNKIDFLKLTIASLRYTDIIVSHFSWEDRIIMILSIKENPISYLIPYLK